MIISRTNVASVGSVFNDTINSRRRAFARNVDFSFIVSGSERTFTFRVSIFFLTLHASYHSFCDRVFCLHKAGTKIGPDGLKTLAGLELTMFRLE